MSVHDAVHQLESAREQLQVRLARIDAERTDVADELARIDDALSALDPHPDDHADGGVPKVLDYTGKYRPLWQDLRDRDDDKWDATFADVEEVLGFPLPPSSRKHLPTWYGTSGSSVALAIHAAGWKATQVKLDNETVLFRRRQP